MTTAETADNHPATDSEPLLSAQDMIVKQLDHLDHLCHDIQQRITSLEAKADSLTAFITEHQAALARGLSMLDPGAGMRKFLGGKHKKD